LEKFVSGALPNVMVERTRTGPGTNRVCYGCEQPIAPTQLQDDIELGRTVMVRLHRECFLMWQAEMSRLGRVISGGSGELLDLEAFRRRIARQTRLLTLSVDIRVLASQARIRSREARRRAEQSLARSRAGM
jgi:hypothetical protein